jgi:hypothetical protein
MSKNDFKFYERNGKQYDRITSALDFFAHPKLVKWKVEVGNKEAKRISTVATKIGTNVDEAVRAAVSGQKVPKLLSDEAKSAFEGFKLWMHDYDPQGLESATEPAFHDELGVACTADLLQPFKVIDIKCASSIKPQYWLQTEFQGRCMGATHKAILRLDKNLGMYEYKEMALSDSHWEVCRGLIKAYRFYNQDREVTA